MQVGDPSLWSKDVQRLLWAAGEAHARARREEDPGPARRHGAEPPAPVADPGFFTVWQPPTGWSRS
jgi:hypothetical protein